MFMIGLRCGGALACFMMAAYAIGRHTKSHDIAQAEDSRNSQESDELTAEVGKLRKELEEMKLKREADRCGRIRAERALREQTVKGDRNKKVIEAGTTEQEETIGREGDGDDLNLYRMRPIGWLRSCYRRRFGTPRQGTVVHGGRATLKLTSECNPLMSTCNLSDYSHVWLIYIFHENTNLGTKTQVKSKVRPPRLGGEKVGLFSTRTPHRPNPIGLSLVRLQKIEKGVLHFSGLDLIDGTPILDVKPYLPSSDSIPPEQVAMSYHLQPPTSPRRCQCLDGSMLQWSAVMKQSSSAPLLRNSSGSDFEKFYSAVNVNQGCGR